MKHPYMREKKIKLITELNASDYEDVDHIQ